jgi:hypothetical protein
LTPSSAEFGLEARDAALLTLAASLNLIAVVLADYVSLFVVRQFLNYAKAYPVRASLISSVIGMGVIVVSFWLFTWTATNSITYFGGDTSLPRTVTVFFQFMSPAFVVHLWLPIFTLSSLTVRLVFWTFRAVEWAQWFLKQGDAHPLKAVGVVAFIIVFGSAMVVKEGWALL